MRGHVNLSEAGPIRPSRQEHQRAGDDLLIRSARYVACWLLDHDQERLRHSEGVAARASSLADTVPAQEAGLLVAAAWLHDVGYSTALKDTGFHPVDGARHLRSTGWDPMVCDLVAHHSGSRFVAHERNLDKELAEFTYREDPLSDALTIADQTVGLDGRPRSLEARMRDMLERHGPDSPNARAHPERRAYLRAAQARVNRRLKGVALGDRMIRSVTA